MISVEDTVRSYMRALEAGDAAGLAELFTEDAAIMPDEMATIRGRSAIQSTFESFFAAISIRCDDLGVDRIEEFGERAIAESHSRETVTNRAQNSAQTIDFRELFCLRHVGDHWRIVSYMFNQPTS